MSPDNSVRNFLAAMGANIKGYENSFTDNENYFGNRATTNNIERGDNLIKERFGMNCPVPPPAPNVYSYPSMNSFETLQPPSMSYNSSISNVQVNKPSREERLNKLLGKNINNSQPQETIPENEMMINAFKKALEPITEQLEDIAVLNGLLVQRIEQLINIVNDEQPVNNEINEPFQGEEFSEEPVEVYNPEVSMSVIDEVEENIQEKSKKKRKKTV